jgi:hypothetical protein
MSLHPSTSSTVHKKAGPTEELSLFAGFGYISKGAEASHSILRSGPLLQKINSHSHTHAESPTQSDTSNSLTLVAENQQPSLGSEFTI